MIWIIFGGIVGGGYVLYIAYDLFDSWWSRIVFGVLLFVPSVFIGCLLGVILSLPFGLLVHGLTGTEYVLDSQQPIYSIQDNMTTSGRFALGSGYVDGDLHIYYVVEEDGFKTIGEAARKDVQILEVDEAEPTVKTYKEQYEQTWAAWIAFPCIGKRVELTVPEGTIYSNYNIDLQ